MLRHSTWLFSRYTCSATPCNRSAALFRRPFPSVAVWGRFSSGPVSPAVAATSSLRGFAASFSSAVASPPALLSRAVVGVRPSPCAAFDVVAGFTFSGAPPPTPAACAAAGSPSGSDSFQAALPPHFLLTPGEACQTTVVLSAVAAATAFGPAATVRAVLTNGDATRGEGRLPFFCVEEPFRLPILSCNIRRFSIFACNPLSLHKTEDMRAAKWPFLRKLTLAEGLRGGEIISSALHTSCFWPPATKLNRLPEGSSRSIACTTSDLTYPRVESSYVLSLSRWGYARPPHLCRCLCPFSSLKSRSPRSCLIKGAGQIFKPVVLEVATFATARNAASFDIFQRLKDPPDAVQQDDAESAATGKKRKPSDRVLHLVDEIMNLTLIEAADLCDLCQEKLAERAGGPTFSAAAAVGRTPFPHPAAMFAGVGMPGMMPTAMPSMGTVPTMTAVPQAGLPDAPQAGPAGAQPAKTPGKKEEAKATFSVKLTGFDAAKKVAVVKEVRAITALGLRESKDLVEQAPKILKKGVPAAEAEALKKKLEAAGAQVTLE